MTPRTPRYRRIADRLRQRIASGALKPGEALPTEMELCEKENISRHTAREALRLLSEEGLITRKRGAGTIVSAPPPPAFAQPLSDFESILQYARDAALDVFSRRPASAADLRRMQAEGEYILFSGLRGQSGSVPVALTHILVLAAYAPSLDELRALAGSISEWIEAEQGLAVTTVTQSMEAVALTGTDALKLGVERDSPALRTVRRYKDARGRHLLISESLHPAGRFVYEMTLKRTRG